MIAGTRSAALRVTVAVASLVVVGGTLAGCSRIATAETPAASTSSQSAVPTPDTTTAAPSVQSIQSELNSANSADSNASGDVTAGDQAAATNDNN